MSFLGTFDPECLIRRSCRNKRKKVHRMLTATAPDATGMNPVVQVAWPANCVM